MSGIPVAIRREGQDVLGMARFSRVLPDGRSEFDPFAPFEALNTTDKNAVRTWARANRPELLPSLGRRDGTQRT